MDIGNTQNIHGMEAFHTCRMVTRFGVSWTKYVGKEDVLIPQNPGTRVGVVATRKTSSNTVQGLSDIY